MASSLLDRPVRGTPRAARSRAVPVLLLVVAGLLGALLLRGLDWPGLPFGSETVDRSATPLLTSLADLEEYHAATGSFQVVVDLEKDTRWVPSLLSGERTTFLATGSVDAVVDFTGLDGAAVDVSDDGRSVVFTLPPARLDEADVDLAESRVLSRDRGLLDRVGGLFSDNPTGEREVAALAEDKLDAAAAGSDLRATAEANTRAMLTGLARSLGYTDVEVRFDADAGL
ncbi:MAG: DUF4230 domain-containing protein [Frankiales bacterium]|nr:MAG: DUF4230 domain-containing protein [Frankiales bacterium]TBR15179.1 MAG: DUF4230 domain-containing protein [Chitinophagaceae bacterium]